MAKESAPSTMLAMKNFSKLSQKITNSASLNYLDPSKGNPRTLALPKRTQFVGKSVLVRTILLPTDPLKKETSLSVSAPLYNQETYLYN